MPTDLLKIDPATAMPSVELDALIATEWMEWKAGWCALLRVWNNGDDCSDWAHAVNQWSPTTNAAHAGEARRRVDSAMLDNMASGIASCTINGEYYQRCSSSEVTGTDDEIKEHTEALATCRAILAAIQARHRQAKLEDES